MGLASAISLRAERENLLRRARRAARALTAAVTRPPGDGVLLCACLRDEAPRLEWFLDYYRRLGVGHFLMIDNGSRDDGPALLADQPDVSLWRARGSYRAARFGMDWVNALLARHARGRWALTVDPDEFLIYPHCDTRPLPALTDWLDHRDRQSLGAMLVDLYPETPGLAPCPRGADPIAAAPWFDAAGHLVERDPRYHNLWIRGGPRLRALFADAPRHAPALNKIPLVKWRGRPVYASSTHALLPRRLNRTYARDRGEMLSACLLHAKFLAPLAQKAGDPEIRAEHYEGGREYAAYAAALAGGRGFFNARSTRYEDWRQLAARGLMGAGLWA